MLAHSPVWLGHADTLRETLAMRIYCSYYCFCKLKQLLSYNYMQNSTISKYTSILLPFQTGNLFLHDSPNFKSTALSKSGVLARHTV